MNNYLCTCENANDVTSDDLYTAIVYVFILNFNKVSGSSVPHSRWFCNT